MDAAPGPLGIRLTCYRLLNVSILFSVVITKGVLAYKGHTIAPTTPEWVGGALLEVVVYWIGLYEHRKGLEWFFRVDLAPAIGYLTKRLVGGFMGFLLYRRSLLVVVSLYFFLKYLGVYILDHTAEHLSLSKVVWAVYGLHIAVFPLLYMMTVLIHVLCAEVLRCQCVSDFMDNYGPPAPLAERYWWFGAVGKVVGVVCGCTLCRSLFAVIVPREDPSFRTTVAHLYALYYWSVT